MSDLQWYIAIQGQQSGPMSAADIQAKVRSGEIGPATYVFKQGMANWVPLVDVPELQPGAAPVPATPPPPVSAKRGHFDYEICGNEMQYVEIELDPGETVIAEAGGMMYMETGIEMETRFGDGSKPDQGFAEKLFEGIKRKLTRESLFMTWFTNNGRSGKKKVAFAAPYPGKIVQINLNEIGGEYICQKDAFLCAALGTEVSATANRSVGAGFLGGEGFIMQRLRGQGRAFVHAGGTILERELQPGETLRIDTGCVVGFTRNVEYDIKFVKGLKSMFFGGEGIAFATLTGPGKILLQSLPFSRLAGRIYAAAPQTGGSRKGEGSVLGGLGDLLGGDR